MSSEKGNLVMVGKTAEKLEEGARRGGLQTKTSDSPAAPVLMVDAVELRGNPAADARTVTNCVAVTWVIFGGYMEWVTRWSFLHGSEEI